MSSATFLNDFTKGELLVNIRGADITPKEFLLFHIRKLRPPVQPMAEITEGLQGS